MGFVVKGQWIELAMNEKKDFGLIPAERLPRSLAAEKRLKEIIERKDAAKIVAKMPTLDFYILVKDVGMADALELIRFAQPEKLKECIDIDCWKRYEPDMKNAALWTAGVLETSDEKKLASVLDELDNELITLWFSRAFKVYPLYEDPDPFVDMTKPLVKTPDGDYLLEINDEDEYGAIMAKLLDAIYSLDITFARMLLEGALAETPTLLTEDALRLRTARMEELGFVDYIQAIEIFALIDPNIPLEKLGRLEKPAQTIAEKDALVIWKLEESDIFASALNAIEEPSERDIVITSLASLANKLATAFDSSVADDENFPEILAFARDALSLALAYRAGNNLAKAKSLLLATSATIIFRIGYSLIKKRYYSLRILFKKGLFGGGALPTLLDEPYKAFYTFLSDRLPKLCEIDDAMAMKPVRNFKTPTDLAIADQIIAEFDILASHFPAAMRVELADFKPADEATYAAVFGTRLALWLIDEASVAEKLRPLTKTELASAMKLMFVSKGRGRVFSPLACEGREKILVEPISQRNEELRAVAIRLADRFTRYIEEQAGGIDPEKPIDPKFVKGFWLKL
ncbi:MAG: hypothetical protein Kow0090_08650 [Myxococcota bacterium]